MSTKKLHLYLKDRLDAIVRSQFAGVYSAFLKAIGANTGSADRWKKGTAYPSYDQINRICNSTGVSHQWLLTGEGEMWRKAEKEEAVAEALSVGKGTESAKKPLETAHKDKEFAQEQARNCQALLREERGKISALGLEMAEQKDLLRKSTREIARYQGIIRGLRRRITGLSEEPALVEGRLQQEIDAANRLD